MPVNPNPNLAQVYQQLCESYRAIDDMRMKLLAALPLATGTGIFLLLNKDSKELVHEYSPAIGVFGFLVTFGLALYEVYGIRKCHALIVTGEEIENQLDVPGQFRTRPGALLGLVKEPVAGGFIYPAVLAAWTYVALYSSPTKACWAAVLVFSFGLAFSLLYEYLFRKWRPPELDKWVEKHPRSGSPGSDGGDSQHPPSR
jgi:hypothetical protein